MHRKYLARNLLLLAIWQGQNALAQNVTTLTPEPFDASGGLSVAADGNIFIANFGARFHDPNPREIYKVTPEGTVSLFAEGEFYYPVGNTFDSQGNLYQSSLDGDSVHKITPEGVITPFAGSEHGLDGPTGLVFDAQGNLYAGNCVNHNIVKVTPGGASSLFAGGQPMFRCPTGLAFDEQGNLYATNWYNSNVVKITPGGVATVLADTSEWTPAESTNIMMVFTNGRLYFANYNTHRIYELTLDGTLKPFAGSGELGRVDGPLLEASLQRPYGLDVSPDGRFLYVNTHENDLLVNPGIRTPNVIRVIEMPNVAEPFQINAGLNDAWVSTDAPLQGFFFTVFPDLGFFFLSWFTFDSVPPASGDAVFGAIDQRWVTGGGAYSGDTATISVELTTGGVFNAADPMAVQTPGYGSITIVFVNCNEAILTYDFPSLGLSGQMTLTRAVTDNVPLCEMLAAP